MTRKPLLGAALAVVVAATACSGGTDEPLAEQTATVTATVSVTVTAEPGITDSASSTGATDATDATDESGVGQPYDNLGATVTINAVRSATKIDTIENGTVQAGDGARFVILDATVQNNAKTSMDLTCSYPIGNKLIDAEDREFDSIEDLYDIPGNPECNSQLQPGFSSEMTWIYRIPSDAEVVAWEFADYSDYTADPGEPTRIPLDGADAG